MTAKLHVITDKLPDQEANAAAIFALQSALARALEGDVVGVAIVTVTRDRSIDWDISATSHFHEINSGLTLAQHEWIREDRDG